MTEQTGEQYLHLVLHPRDPETNKNHYGRVLAVCGSRSYCGAPFAAMGAVRTGSGIVTLAVPDCIHTILACKLNEPTFSVLPSDSEGKIASLDPAILRGKAAVLAGPGLGLSDAVREIIAMLVTQAEVPLILDADGINALQGHIDILERAKHPVILTPHGGEFARICDVPRVGGRRADGTRVRRKAPLCPAAQGTYYPDCRSGRACDAQSVRQRGNGEGRQRRCAQRHHSVPARTGRPVV